MILLCAWIIWLGNRRGMAYWNWLGGYLFISGIGLIVRIVNGPDAILYFLSIICIIYLIAFTSWPYLVSDGYAKALEIQAEENKEFENKKAKIFYDSLSDWSPVKTYIDGSQLYELHNDRHILEDNSIPSFVKTAGITTISVKNEHFEKASELLGVLPLDLSDPSSDDDNI